MNENICFGKADILLPDFDTYSESYKKWAVVACDQYTSEPWYWERVKEYVADSPSTLNMILPEAFLADSGDGELLKIAEHMADYERKLLKCYKNSLIYIERKTSNGKIRRGIVGAVDLEEYDYRKGSLSAVRATEGTVLERIPPRVAVRRKASIELPHIMLLIDDAKKDIIESLSESCAGFEKLYDFELMEGGGFICGRLVPNDVADGIIGKMSELFKNGRSGISLAVGDGNHSLASAKARYEEIKAELGDAALTHPLRYALCEVVNLHDDALEFEPIYRIVKTDDADGLSAELSEYAKTCEPNGDQSVKMIYNGTEKTINFGAGTHSLTVGTLQKFLDMYTAKHPTAKIDYIHGEDSLMRLAKAENTVGFLFGGMKKEELFTSVSKDGALPRKTFSMGSACDKRFYIECRSIL